MKWIDVFKLGTENLLKRKLRTFLTVLSVMIGSTSIILIVSLGNGLQETTTKQFKDFGNLNIISVMPTPEEDGKKFFTDKDLDFIKNIEGVEVVTPVRRSVLTITTSKYQSSYSFKAVDGKYIEKMDFELDKGRALKNEDRASIMLGYGASNFFYPIKQSLSVNKGNGTLDTEIDFLNESLKISYESIGSGEESNQEDQQKKIFPIKVVGITAEGKSDLRYDALISIKELDKILAYFKLDKNGYPLNSADNKLSLSKNKKNEFDELEIMAKDQKDVKNIQKKLKEMNYTSVSMIEAIASINNIFDVIKLVLGGIAAISLFIAGIGIMNTMMMSVYERKKEIGVMKVIGASLNDIRFLFLFEAAFIGILGGTLGLMISYSFSFILNQISPMIFASMTGATDPQEAANQSMKISIIPLWMSFGAVGFTAFIGLISGYLPARRAMMLSALEAIQS
jgi:putative ABC transport system permease protein